MGTSSLKPEPALPPAGNISQGYMPQPGYLLQLSQDPSSQQPQPQDGSESQLGLPQQQMQVQLEAKLQKLQHQQQQRLQMQEQVLNRTAIPGTEAPFQSSAGSNPQLMNHLNFQRQQLQQTTPPRNRQGRFLGDQGQLQGREVTVEQSINLSPISLASQNRVMYRQSPGASSAYDMLHNLSMSSTHSGQEVHRVRLYFVQFHYYFSISK